MAGLIHRYRMELAQVTFVMLVLVIPAVAGVAWLEHQRTTDLSRLQKLDRRHAAEDDWQLYDGLVAACNRVNVIRSRQNTVVALLLKHDPAFPLRPQPLVVCTQVVKHPSLPRPVASPR